MIMSGMGNVGRRMMVCGLAWLAMVARGEESPAPDAVEPADKTFNAVVKLEVVMSRANPTLPWQNINDGGDGSGVVIGNGRILTCAHCVTDATYIRIRKNSEESIYKGTVEFIDNDCDLALVKVVDPAFMRDITPMQIGVTPVEQARVLAVGYPLGGLGVAFTEGVVSRIEDREYAHSLMSLLAIQVDAAINPGNSGGPVLEMESGRICGIAFQGDKRGEALGYLIPPDIINHFLRDVEDGVVNGFGSFFFFEDLESEAARKYYGMADGQTGVRIPHDTRHLGAHSLKEGDILLEVDGCRVSNNGYVRIGGNKRRSLYFPFTMRQIGDQVPVTVLRAGKLVKAQVPIQKVSQCVRGFLYDKKPDYFVFGGFAFSTVTYDFLGVSKRKYTTDIAREKSFADEEDVALVQVLSDNCVEGYLGAGGLLVRSVNGEKVRNLKHLVAIIESCRTPFMCFGIDGGNEWETTVVVETAKMRAATPNILRTYQIPADRSADLR